MDEFSFDPRSWLKKGPDGADTAPRGAASGTPEPGHPTDETLPEAWRGIASSPGHEPVTASTGSGYGLNHFTLAGSIMLLVVASAGAWLTRLPVAEHPEHGRKATAQPKTPAAAERSIRLAGTESIAAALTAFGIAPADAQSVAAAAIAGQAKPGEIGLKALLNQKDGGAALVRVQISYSDGSGSVIEPDSAGGFKASMVAADLTSAIKFVPGEIDTQSFYSSAVSAGVPDTLVPEFINAFGYDFNLASEVTPGDTFEVAFEQSVNGNGEAVGQPQLLYAKLTTEAKSLALYRLRQPNGEVGWYDGNGATIKRGMMRTPVDGARITSKFGMRFHPTLHYNRLHGGVDFGAPTGTPIYAAADGIVTFAAAKGCNGNLTVIKHEDGKETFYLHQSRWMPEISVGAHVRQGMHIGDVGMTPGGICVTGPHLHYEVHINGEKVDPLSVPTDTGKREKLQGIMLAEFIQQRNRIDVARARQAI